VAFFSVYLLYEDSITLSRSSPNRLSQLAWASSSFNYFLAQFFHPPFASLLFLFPL